MYLDCLSHGINPIVVQNYHLYPFVFAKNIKKALLEAAPSGTGLPVDRALQVKIQPSTTQTTLFYLMLLYARYKVAIMDDKNNVIQIVEMQ